MTYVRVKVKPITIPARVVIDPASLCLDDSVASISIKDLDVGTLDELVGAWIREIYVRAGKTSCWVKRDEHA